MQYVVLKAQPMVRAAWCGLQRTSVMTSHIFYKAFQGSTRRIKQYTSHDAFHRTATAHASGAELLEHARALGWKMPAVDSDVLKFMEQTGLWTPGVESDGALVDAVLSQGVDGSQPNKADGERISAMYLKPILVTS